MTTSVKLLELAQRGRAASPPASVIANPSAPVPLGACMQCRSLPGELCARVEWPARYDVERCTACSAVLSYVAPEASTTGYTVRKRIVRP